ncbi:hypothetical protein TCAL_02709 [Tigriopus californicus]|uniref:CAP-Gly domain-containing protein n=1 Tax=Tigriopus californicus TaxID=6832 RepID=A0A553PHC3_TIGCA|nr:CAP-Gly domain-containing linker protein 1-like isoform X1 [Tigriopus californicus]TRY77089.1 hypothetical protein TCAL_02709 [Tigriopus californicus]|eukprot:TCALIF_02709-PA protein Name:"Similar to CLIP1 CAP-Gly domain-containing linker protein 1 (Gallus gallus)" AED:0.07 eAED:0.09 QI:145/1/0.75/1/1/0.75/4/0/1786
MSQLPRPVSKIAKPVSHSHSCVGGHKDHDQPVEEDFKVGDKVWVGGTKAGKIAFLGETKFAPGEWAGVFLDDPVGKNDGSVAGVSYFKCEAMHGVFSRASKLSRQPLASGPPSCLTTPRKVSKVGRASISPSESQANLKSETPSPTGSTISLASMGPLKVGDRVIVSNAITGTKAGTLRYIGPTDFAAGEFGGVELDSAIGKNDGMVGDKRYFQCQPNFGIFAPMHKISKSPKNRMQRQPSNLTPRKLNRERSDLSDISMASVVSTVSKAQGPVKKKSIASILAPERLKMSLKEKEDKIDNLLKERDLERAQIAKAASQTDEAEENLSRLREEYENYKFEQDERAAAYQSAVEQYEEKIRRLKNKLEDEKKKSEDIEFKLEEETVMRTETEAGNSAELIEKIRSLEEQLAAEFNAKAEWSGGKAEFETKIKDLQDRLGSEQKNRVDVQIDIESLKEELEAEKKKVDAKAKEVELFRVKLVTSEEKLKETRVSLDVFKEESGNKVFETEEQVMLLKDEIEGLKTDLEEAQSNVEFERKNHATLQESLKSQSTTTIAQVNELEKNLAEKDNELIELKHKFASLESGNKTLLTTLDDKAKDIKERTLENQTLKEHVSKAEQEGASIRQELKAANLQLEDANNMVKIKESNLKEIQASKVETEKQLANRSKEIDALKAQLDKSGSDTQIELQKKSEQVIELESKLAEIMKTVKVLEQDSAKISIVEGEMRSVQKELEEANLAKAGLEKELMVWKDSSQTNTDEVKRLSGTVNSKDLELETLRGDLAAMTGQLKDLKVAIDQTEAENAEKLDVAQRESKKAIHELEEKLRKTEAAKEKVEKSKEEVIKDLNSKIRTTTTEHDQLAKNLREDIAKRVIEIESWQSKYSALQESLSSSTNESSKTLNELKQKVADLETNLNVKNRENTALQDELLKLTETAKQLEATKQELDIATKGKIAAEALNKDFAQKLTTSQGKLSELAREKIHLEKSIQDMQNTSLDSNVQITSLNDEINAKKAELDQIKHVQEEEKETYRKSLDEKAKEVTAKEIELQKVLESKASVEEEFKKEIKKLQEDIEGTKAAKAKMASEAEEARAKATEAEEEAKIKISEITHRLEALGNDFKVKENALQSAESELKEEKVKRMELEQALEKSKRSHEDELEELVDAINDLKMKEEELEATKEELELKSIELEKVNKEHAKARDQFQTELKFVQEQAQKELDVLTKQQEETKGQITYLKESMGGSKVEYDLQVDKLAKQLDTLKTKHEEEIYKKDDLLKKMREDIANKEEELDFVKEELQAKTEELMDINTDLEVKEAGFNNSFKETEEQHKDEVEVLVSKVEEAKQEISELSETLAKTIADHDAKLDDMKIGRKTEVNTLQDQISERDRAILDLKATLEGMQTQVASLTSSQVDEAKIHEAKLGRLNVENEELRLKKRDLESTLKTLQADFDQMNHLKEDLTIKVVEKEKQVKEFTSQVQTMRVTYEKTQKELSERVEKSSQDGQALKEVEMALHEERLRVDELQIALAEAESERDCARSKSKDLQKISQHNNRLEEQNEALKRDVADLKQKLAFSEQESQSERAELNEVVQQSKDLLREKLEEFKIQKQQYETLKLENQQLNSYRRDLMIVEQEKRDLESQLVTLTYEARSGRRSPSPAKSFTSDMPEGELKGQVDFLNSVIVDMQRKNDELKTKLELFESAGIIDAEAEAAFMFNGVSSRQVAPRLFCDICDEFDIHDTEDCPTQAMDIPDEVVHTKSGGVRGQIREYCDICEVFGHSTENCSETETY